MNQPTPDYTVETLSNYSQDDAAAIGGLMHDLSDRFNGEPTPEQLLRDIIDSPYHEQFVARRNDGIIIGTATISITIGAATGRSAWLEQLVINPHIQGSGVGSALWNSLIDWCREKNVVKMEFTSRSSKEAAQRFYEKRGATIRDTNFFNKVIE